MYTVQGLYEPPLSMIDKNIKMILEGSDKDRDVCAIMMLEHKRKYLYIQLR